MAQMVATCVVNVAYREVEAICCTSENNVTLCVIHSNKKNMRKKSVEMSKVDENI